MSALPRLPGPGLRQGFTLIELIVSMTVFGVIMASSMALLAEQSRAFHRGTERLEALQNLRYAIQTLDNDVYTAGTNVASGQPALVYADSFRLAFHADYTTDQPGDVSAVFVDPTAPSGQLSTPSAPVTIPGTTYAHPSAPFLVDGVPSPAELIVFFFEPDAATPRTDDYALWRQVNHATPELVSRGLLRNGSDPFFTYLGTPDEDSPTLPAFDASLLPLVHAMPTHGEAADTGAAARIDQVRALRVSLTSTNDRPGAAERQVSARHVVRVPNVRFDVLETCGASPLLGTAPGASAGTGPGGVPEVALTWTEATDEAGGELDVIRYVLWRREQGEPTWGDPFRSVPAGQTTYTYVDFAIESGKSYQYALAAQDCTPSLSPRATSPVVTAP